MSDLVVCDLRSANGLAKVREKLVDDTGERTADELIERWRSTTPFVAWLAERPFVDFWRLMKSTGAVAALVLSYDIDFDTPLNVYADEDVADLIAKTAVALGEAL
jgi:hypothetical protein